MNPPFMKELFVVKNNNYNLRDCDNVIQPFLNTVKYGKKSFSYFGAHIWNLLPVTIKKAVSLNMFKNMIKVWGGPNCQCSLCYCM